MLLNPRDLQPQKDLRLTGWSLTVGRQCGLPFENAVVIFLMQCNLVWEELLREQYGGASGGDEACG